MNWLQLLSARRSGTQRDRNNEISRSAFEQDYDRIIFSHPFRRLQDKTQVHPLPEHDFIHTRLTHSLEVSSVARSLGRKIGEQIVSRHKELTGQFTLFDVGAITAAAALAHDIGNPPFGHAGESALSDFFVNGEGSRFKSSVTAGQWLDLVNFEGNAQGFRILCMPNQGLRLTAATLGAFTKYPCSSHIEQRDRKRKSQRKFGYFDTEANLFGEVAEDVCLIKLGEGVWTRHPLAFLVEAADDICYNIIDLEDACRLGLVSLPETIELLAPILGDSLDRSKLDALNSLNDKLGILRAMSINRLIDSCAEVFLDNEEMILSGEFDKALTDLCSYSSQLDAVSELSVKRIYQARSVMEIEAAGHEVLPGLLESFSLAGEFILAPSPSRKLSNLAHLLPEETQFLVKKSSTHYEMLRLIIDFVSGLTDKHAITLYRRLRGLML